MATEKGKKGKAKKKPPGDPLGRARVDKLIRLAKDSDSYTDEECLALVAFLRDGLLAALTKSAMDNGGPLPSNEWGRWELFAKVDHRVHALRDIMAERADSSALGDVVFAFKTPPPANRLKAAPDGDEG